ncbi:MAG: hypothetical protein HQL40_03980 [Alphaproteobacteria bacterium]|nr:hypothetical protein [Alphaproteobacteria bacterium]
MTDLTSMRADLEALAMVLRDGDDGGWHATRVRVSGPVFQDDPAAVLNRLDSARDGWLALPGRVVVRVDGGWLDAPPEPGGRPLRGEFLMNDGSSLAIAWVDGRGWAVTHMVEGDGEAGLARTTVVQSILADHPRYVWRSYWRLDENAGYRPWGGRFMGFGEVPR